MAQNYSKWLHIAPTVSKLPQMAANCLKWLLIASNISKYGPNSLTGHGLNPLGGHNQTQKQNHHNYSGGFEDVTMIVFSRLILPYK